MASTPTSPGKARQIDPDHNGDLVLILGTIENEIRIRVSSKVLCLASPVFAAITSPNFAEGRILSERNSLELALPDDEPEAMSWFYHALHFRQNLHAVSLPLLENLAVLCDKYDASLALSFCSEVLLSEIPGSIDGEDCHLKMLWISYAFGNHRAFWSTSRQMIRNYTTEDIRELDVDSVGIQFPEQVLGSINTEREASLHKLLAAIESVLIPHIQTPCPVSHLHRLPKSPCSHLSKSGHYLQELLRLGLWPISNTIEHKTVESVAGQIIQLENYYDRYGSNGTGAICKSPSIDLEKRLQEVLSEHSEDQKGLCLNCVRHGKATVNQGNCVASSRVLCKT